MENINKAILMIEMDHESAIITLLSKLNKFTPFQISSFIKNDLIIREPLQRDLMTALMKRDQGVTVDQARKNGVKNPTLQVQEIRKRGGNIIDQRVSGVDKKSVYRIVFKNQ